MARSMQAGCGKLRHVLAIVNLIFYCCLFRQRWDRHGRTLGTETRGSADVADNKAVRTSMAAALNEKVSATFSSTSDGLGDLFKHLGANSGGPVPKAKSKAKAKNKKVLTQDEQNRRDFDKSLEKPLGQLVHVN